MTHSDIDVLKNTLHALYGDRFPGLLPEMAQMWHDDLQPFEASLVTRAVKRWARQHTLYPPSLDELLEAVEWLTDQDHRTHLPTPDATPLQVLADTQARARAASPTWTTADRVFGKLMLELVNRAIEQPRNFRNAAHAQQCRDWAAYYAPKSVDLQGWLLDQAVIYDRLVLKEPLRDAPTPGTASLPRLGAVGTLPAIGEGCLHEHLNANETVCNDCGEVFAATDL